MNLVNPTINPFKHYWLADDGRVYSAPLQNIVTTNDPGYVDFTGSGGVAVRWPVDEAGVQTDEALLEALEPHGLSLSPASALLTYSARKRYEKQTGGIQIGKNTIPTDRETQSIITNAVVYVQINPGTSVKFKHKTGFMTLNPAELSALDTAVGAHVQDCFDIEFEVAGKITAGTITTLAQIDAAYK
jgi:hypothetical protein